MNFDTVIYNQLNSLIGHLAPGGLYSSFLPENWDLDKTTMVFNYRVTNNERTLDPFSDDKDYELTLIMLDKSSDLIASVAEKVFSILEEYSASVYLLEDAPIADITFLNDLNSVDWDLDNLHLRTLNYTVIFNN